MRHQIKEILSFVLTTVLLIGVQSCSDFEKYELPESGSIPDETPPVAFFEATQGEAAAFLTYNFANLSTSATTYLWEFGDGNTSTDLDGVNTYPDEGTYTVTLTASDNLGVISTYSEVIDVIEPEMPAVPNPVLVNADFNKLPKSSGSDCSCSAWINKDLGDQGESSSGNGGTDNVVKYDNNEPDATYQEFEVMPNADYTIAVVVSFKDPTGGPYPSMLEVRVLAGSGYVSGYTPIYYTDTVDFPQEDWGYTSVSQVENAANNLIVETINNPDNDSYLTYAYTFNSGANNSLALFIRGIGGDNSGEFGYNSGDEEIRIDTVTIEAN